MSRKEDLGWLLVTGALSGAFLGPLGYLVVDSHNRQESFYSESLKEISEQGYDGDLTLVDIRTVPGFQLNGSVGGFLAFSGSVNGETKTILQFAWKTKGEQPKIVISEMPIDEVVFQVNDKIENYNGPQVNFNIDSPEIRSSGLNNPLQRIDLGNPNNLMQYVTKATFTMTQKDFDSFRGNQPLK